MDFWREDKIYNIFCFVVESDLFFFVFVVVNEIVNETANLIYFKEGGAASWAEAIDGWDTGDADSFEGFDLRTKDNTFVEGFKVMYETNLAGLTYSFIISKSPCPKELRTILYIIIKSRIQQQTAACRTSSAFARVTMYNHNVLHIIF